VVIPSHPTAQALLASLLRRHGERHHDEAMVAAGMWLACVVGQEPAGMQTLRRVLEEASRPAWMTLRALPRPAPPQEPTRPWWRRWWR
jgi:hypothetical protein